MSSSLVLKSALTFAEACDRGKVREENQDSVRRASTPLGELVMVADGIGGYRGGATASRMVVDSIEAAIAAQPSDCSPARAIAEAAAIANSSVMEAAATGDPAFRNMGSTVVLALITRGEAGATQAPTPAPTQAWIGHIGDSRAFLGRAGRLMRLTRDHSAVQELMDQGRLTPEEARRSPHASVLTRSIGHMPDVEIEMSMVALEDGDTLLLCSDGLWGFVAELAIEQVITDPGADVEAMASTLLNLALQAGGHDNIGIEVVRFSTAHVQPESGSASALPAPQPESASAPAPPAPRTESAGAPASPAPQTEAASVPAPPAPQPESGKSRQRRKALAIAILLFAGLGALAWVAEQQHWIPSTHLSH